MTATAASLILAAALGIQASPPARRHIVASPSPLSLSAPAGGQIAHVFSRAVVTTAPGFDETVRRISGSSSYEVKRVGAGGAALSGGYVYEGAAHGSGEQELRDGGATNCSDGACKPVTDASGLSYNPILWGQPPARLRVGQSWTVPIDRPWELGPSGTQTITVVAVDPVAASVVLEREGSGEGPWADDRETVKLRRGSEEVAVPMRSGRAHWRGYTTFRHGWVMSDELTSDRELRLSTATAGEVLGHQHQYILMNATPPTFRPPPAG